MIEDDGFWQAINALLVTIVFIEVIGILVVATAIGLQ